MMAWYARGDDFKDTTYECLITPGSGRVDVSSWFGPNRNDGPKFTLIEKNPLINLPYVVDHEDDVVVTQSNACMQYLARKLGRDLYGVTAKHAVECDQLLCQIMDLRNAAVGLFYGSGSREAYEAGVEKHLRTTLGHYKKLEAWLASRNGKGGEGATFFVLDDAPTAPDFHAWEMLDQHEAVVKDLGRDSLLGGEFPRLSKFYSAFKKVPELKGYFDSDAAKFPINNPQAAFK